MRPRDPHDQPLRVTTVDDEVVFLGDGPVSFSMTLKAARGTFHNLARALQEVAMRNADSSGPIRARVILLVEDEPIIREVGAAILAEAGYVVIEADGHHQALLALEGEVQIHLLFTDIQISGELTGLDLARVVATRWPAIPLLVTSGQAAPGPGALPVGGRFIPKPYDSAEMLRQIGELMAA